MEQKLIQNQGLKTPTRSEQILSAHPRMKATEAHALLAYNDSVPGVAFRWSNAEGLSNDFPTSICRESEHHVRNKPVLALEYCVL